MLFTFSKENLESILATIEAGTAVALVSFPGSEDDEIIDLVIDKLSGNYKFIDLSFRELQQNKSVEFVYLNLYNTFSPSPPEDSNPTYSSLAKILEGNISNYLLIVRKLHYAYFNESSDEQRSLLSLLFFLHEQVSLRILFSTNVPTSRWYTFYGSPMSERLFFLSPNLLPGKYHHFFSSTFGNIELDKSDKQLLALCGQNRFLLLSASKIIKEHDSTVRGDFYSSLHRFFELIRPYFQNVWLCLEQQEKELLLVASVNWVMQKETNKLQLEKNKALYRVGLNRLVEFDLISLKDDIMAISCPLFAYWIITNIDNVRMNERILREDTYKNQLRNLARNAIKYLDENKGVLTTMAFEILKSKSP